MGNLVKYQIAGIGVFMILLLASYAKYKQREYKPQQYVYWTQDSVLTANYFLKMEPFWSHPFEAAIKTNIGIKKLDNGKIKGFALIDRFNSWCEKEYNESNYLLTHEAYHANITLIGTNWLNGLIEEKDLSYEEAVNARDSIITIIDSLQFQYDLYTRHGLDEPNQYYWEYKIDSMLNINSNIENKDIYSGASAYFPSQPNIYTQQDTFYLSKSFKLDKYEMSFEFDTKYDRYIDTTVYLNQFVDLLKSRDFTRIKAKTTLWNGHYMLESTCLDFTNERWYHDRIIVDKPNFYQVTFSHPYQFDKDSIYYKLKDRFFDSFELTSNEEFWIDQLEKRGIEEPGDVIYHPNDSAYEVSLKLLPYSDNSISYHRPFIYNGILVLAFKSERHDFEDLDLVLLKLNDNKFFLHDPDSLYQIIPLGMNELKEGSNHLQFGYTIKSDSVKNASHFYSTVIENFHVPESN